MRRFRSALVGILAFGVSLAASSPARADAILTLEPSTGVAQPGDTVTFDLFISDVLDLYSFQFDLAYDPSVFSLSAVDQGSFLGDSTTTDFLPGFSDPILGTVSFIGGLIIGNSPGVSGSGILATLTFTAVGLADPSLLTISNILLYDSALQPLNFTASGASVSTVPEPSSLALMGVGIAALYGRRRRRRARFKKNRAAV
jgi:hypothetical protein